MTYMDNVEIPCRVTVSSFFRSSSALSLYDGNSSFAEKDFEKSYTEKNGYTGTVLKKDGILSVFFDSCGTETEIRIHADDKQVEVIRKRAAGTAVLEIKNGVASESVYPTPVGNLTVKTLGEKAEIPDLSDFSGPPFEIFLTYYSEIRGTDLQKISVRITVKNQ